MPRRIKFEVISSLGKNIRTSDDYWKKIISAKHPAMEGQEDLVKHTLRNPDNGANCCVVAKPSERRRLCCHGVHDREDQDW